MLSVRRRVLELWNLVTDLLSGWLRSMSLHKLVALLLELQDLHLLGLLDHKGCLNDLLGHADCLWLGLGDGGGGSGHARIGSCEKVLLVDSRRLATLYFLLLL